MSGRWPGHDVTPPEAAAQAILTIARPAHATRELEGQDQSAQQGECPGVEADTQVESAAATDDAG